MDFDGFWYGKRDFNVFEMRAFQGMTNFYKVKKNFFFFLRVFKSSKKYETMYFNVRILHKKKINFYESCSLSIEYRKPYYWILMNNTVYNFRNSEN